MGAPPPPPSTDNISLPSYNAVRSSKKVTRRRTWRISKHWGFLFGFFALLVCAGLAIFVAVTAYSGIEDSELKKLILSSKSALPLPPLPPPPPPPSEPRTAESTHPGRTEIQGLLQDDGRLLALVMRAVRVYLVGTGFSTAQSEENEIQLAIADFLLSRDRKKPVTFDDFVSIAEKHAPRDDDAARGKLQDNVRTMLSAYSAMRRLEAYGPDKVAEYRRLERLRSERRAQANAFFDAEKSFFKSTANTDSASALHSLGADSHSPAAPAPSIHWRSPFIAAEGEISYKSEGYEKVLEYLKRTIQILHQKRAGAASAPE